MRVIPVIETDLSMHLAAEKAETRPILTAFHAARPSVLIAGGSPQSHSRLKSLINKLDWMRLIPLEMCPEELLKSKIDAEILLISADKLPFTLLEVLAKRFCVICCIEHTPQSAIFGLLRAGIAGIIPLNIGGDELESALRAVQNGLQVVHKSFTEDTHASSIPAEHLTDREQQVLVLMAEGLSNKEISARMSISENTVKFHISSVLGKLGASSRTEAVSIGIRRGLLAI